MATPNFNCYNHYNISAIFNNSKTALFPCVKINSMKTKFPELLAPVGGWAHLTAAANNGADAVYMGGTIFNARIFADNFTDEDLPEAIKYAHLHDVKVYITLNTLIKDSELRRAFEYVCRLYDIGADALIVQDLGLARLVRKYLPDFPLHLSTQGTVYNVHALDTAKALGFTRIVPARELTLDEIRRFTAESHERDIEVECFVHGALCMCYSGQCQMSRGLSTKGDSRSGNRGTCAQPCRQAYTDDAGNKYYALSPKDICAVESIPALIQAGVDSFKIEGRIKAPEYVAIVTKIYRKYIDKYADLLRSNDGDAATASAAYTVDPRDIQYLKQAFNRGGFSQGYLYGNLEDELLSGTSPKNQGVHIGQVVAVIDSESKVDDHNDRSAVRGALRRGRELVCVQMKRGHLAMGDGVEFRPNIPDYEGNPIGNVTTYVHDLGGGLVLLGDFERGAQIGDSVFKVTDKALTESALSAPDKKLPVTFLFTARVGQYIEMVMTDVKSGYSYEIVGDHIIEAAHKVATDEERICEQLCRLGNTPFTADWTSCDIQIDDNAMIPVSLINRMRRDAADQLIEQRLRNERKSLSRANIDVICATEMLGKETLDLHAYQKQFNEGSIKAVPLEQFMNGDRVINDKGVRILPYILNVSKGNLDEYIENNFDAIVSAVRDSGILIGNLGWIKEFQDAGVKVYGDYGLNVFNQQSLAALNEMGVELYAPSHETGIADSRGLPLMITEHPIHSEYLIDRKGAKHKVKSCESEDKYLIY